MDLSDCHLINLSIKKFKISFVLNVKYYSYTDIADMNMNMSESISTGPCPFRCTELYCVFYKQEFV